MREVRSRLGLRSKLFVVFAAIAVALLAVVLGAVHATRSTTAGARNIEVEFSERVATDRAVVAGTDDLRRVEARLASSSPQAKDGAVADSGRRLSAAIDEVLHGGNGVQPSERANVARLDRVWTADLRSRWHGWVSSGLALGAGVLAFVALVGYVSGVTSLYAVSELTQMAVPTSVAFVLLAAAIVGARPEQGPMRLILSDTTGGRLMRWGSPMVLAVPTLLGTLRLAGETAGLYDSATGPWLLALAIIGVLTPLTWSLASSLDRAERASRGARAARAETQRERAAFDDAPIGSALISVDGRYTRVNRALCAMTGYDAEQLVGMRFTELTHPHDRAADAAPFAALLDGSLGVHRTDKRYLHRDGHAIHAHVAVTAIYDETAQPTQLYAQIQDITESRLAAERVEQAQFETLARLAGAAEYRDDETGEHTRRVGDLAGLLAEQLGLDAEVVRLIKAGAPLHDVGKIGIPDSILLKPGRLTEDEFALMKRHTTIGAQMLAGGAYPQVLIAEQIAATHHERWDGTGYPNGLSGDRIPIAGRIVAVADVLDALTHARPYKEAWPRADALAELRRQSGIQFDPRVIDAFFALEARPSRGEDARRRA